MATLKNNLDLGLADGAAITAANSDDNGDDAATLITLQGGAAAVTQLTSASIAAVTAYGMRSTLPGGVGTVATWDWSVTSATQGFIRAYVKWESSNPTQNTRIMRVQTGSTVVWDVRRVSGTSRLALTNGTTTESQYVTLTGNTIYRIEAGSDSSGNVNLRVYEGESASGLTISGSQMTGMGVWDLVRFGLISNAQTYSQDYAALAYSSTDWVGAEPVPSANVTFNRRIVIG